MRTESVPPFQYGTSDMHLLHYLAYISFPYWMDIFSQK